MNEDCYYLFLSPTDSSGLFPNNTLNDFTVQLPRMMTLNGLWTCGLVDLTFNNSESEGSEVIFIACDICQESYLQNSYLPILRRITTPSTSQGRYDISFSNPYYIPVSRDNVESIRVYIRNENLDTYSFKSGTFTCTLHLRRVDNFPLHI